MWFSWFDYGLFCFLCGHPVLWAECERRIGADVPTINSAKQSSALCQNGHEYYSNTYIYWYKLSLQHFCPKTKMANLHCSVSWFWTYHSSEDKYKTHYKPFMLKLISHLVLYSFSFWFLIFYNKCWFMSFWNINVLYVTIKLVTKDTNKVTSRHIKCLFMRESNTHAINVTIKLVIKLISRNIICQYISESNTHAINVTQNLLSKGA